MDLFFDRLLLEYFPNIKYFKGLRSPTHFSSYNFVLNDIFLFDELASIYPYLENLEFLNCQIDFKNTDEYKLSLLARSMLLCFD